MDTDRLAALMRGYHRRDFTGWHRIGSGRYELGFDGYRVVYDRGEYKVVIDGCWFHGEFVIGRIEADVLKVMMGPPGENYGWSLEDRREDGPMIHMEGAPLRRESDIDGWSECYYDLGWPELAETRPIRTWRARTDRREEMDIGQKLSKLAETIMCESHEGLFPDGMDVSTGWKTAFTLRADVLPRDPSDVRCWIDTGGDGWTLSAHGHGYAEESVGFRRSSVDVSLVMTPWSSGRLESRASGRAYAFRRFRDENPPQAICRDGDWLSPRPDERDIYPASTDAWLQSMENDY